MKVIANALKQETGCWINDRAENSHLPFRRQVRAVLRFRRLRCLRKFAVVHSSVHNHFNQERLLNSRLNFKASRSVVFSEWRSFGAG
jgi:putative transposase